MSETLEIIATENREQSSNHSHCLLKKNRMWVGGDPGAPQHLKCFVNVVIQISVPYLMTLKTPPPPHPIQTLTLMARYCFKRHNKLERKGFITVSYIYTHSA
jgi:hypothetical protein